MKTYSYQALLDFIDRLFVAMGTPADLASLMAKSLVGSNLCGHDSHGVQLALVYAQAVNSGQVAQAARASVTPNAPMLATLTVDAALGWGARGFATPCHPFCGLGCRGGSFQGVAQPRKENSLCLAPLVLVFARNPDSVDRGRADAHGLLLAGFCSHICHWNLSMRGRLVCYRKGDLVFRREADHGLENWWGHAMGGGSLLLHHEFLSGANLPHSSSSTTTIIDPDSTLSPVAKLS